MRVTFADASRPIARAAPAADGGWPDARAGVPASMAPTTPLSDVAKLLRSSAIFVPLWRVIIAQLARPYDGSSSRRSSIFTSVMRAFLWPPKGRQNGDADEESLHAGGGVDARRDCSAGRGADSHDRRIHFHRQGQSPSLWPDDG